MQAEEYEVFKLFPFRAIQEFLSKGTGCVVPHCISMHDTLDKSGAFLLQTGRHQWLGESLQCFF